MKTKQQVIEEEPAKVYTLDEFKKRVNEGSINSDDGIGYFHDGEYETGIEVFDENLLWSDIKDFPYVCWYNK